MIENWDLISQIDKQTGGLCYVLVMDGTDKDAYLMAKKLKGYIQKTYAAQNPYTYGFVLPNAMDEITQDKIRTAAREVVELSKKIDNLVPGGNLGDPLFTNTKTTDFPTFIQLETPDKTVIAPKEVDLAEATRIMDVHDTNRTPNLPAQDSVPLTQQPEQTTPAAAIPPTESVPLQESMQPQESTQPQADFEEINPVNLRKQTIPAPAQTETSSTISISDNDMLIKDMEGSMLEKMPLNEILSADTKYDMFMDVDQNTQQIKHIQEEKDQKIAQAQPPTESFNVFEQDLKEQNNVMDVEEVQTITDRLTQKGNEFMNNTNQPQEEKSNLPPVAPTAADATSKENTPFTLGAAQEPPQSMMDELSLETLPEEEKLENTLPPQSLEKAADLPEITVRTGMDKLDKTFNLETTFNTDFIRQQEEKTRSLRESEEEPPHTKTILRLKKQAEQTPPQSPEQMGKTILRLRRKNNAPSAPNPAAAKTLRSTVSPAHASANKQNNIDHSIQIPTSELKKHNWPLEVPLVPTYTLNNMVMSVNRFAHATAISVIENPGKLYNPLVLHGGTGTGKTHFLNALAYAFSKKFGQEHVFMTNGVRLSRGIQRYVMEGNIDKFENFMKSVQALLIDDIHLLAINEQNRTYVSRLLNDFLKAQKQIVITSKYPPESLEKLEELIQFKLDSGWISELKPATGATHFRIVKKMLIENGVELNDKQIEEFFGAPHMTLGTVTRSIRRLKVLESLIFPGIPSEQKSQAGIFEKLLATRGEDRTSELFTKDPAEITSLNMAGNGEWGRIGFFYPQNCSDMMNWMVYALEQRAKELGIEGGFEIVVRSSYATENIISSAFKIANLCDNKKLKGAVILGPKPGSCDPSVRENFYDILTHMLEIMLIRCGIINYENVRLPSTYVKVLSELMR